ncbi:Uncharacterised protein [Escherichia coli]|nr:Uncharacterised protein [Escherichia coli]
MRLWCGLQAAPSLIQVRDDETPYRSIGEVIKVDTRSGEYVSRVK